MRNLFFASASFTVPFVRTSSESTFYIYNTNTYISTFISPTSLWKWWRRRRRRFPFFPVAATTSGSTFLSVYNVHVHICIINMDNIFTFSIHMPYQFAGNRTTTYYYLRTRDLMLIQESSSSCTTYSRY